MNDYQENQAVLALEDGTLFYGRTSGPKNTICGEIIFNTSMTGYQEICTDPSYANQIVLFTTSHIGNVGVNEEDKESSQPWVKGIIAREMSKMSSNWRSEKKFTTFLDQNNIPWIEGLDTRKLTRHIRQKGTKNACIMVGEIDADLAVRLAKEHVKAEGLNLSQETLKAKPYKWHERNSLRYKLLAPHLETLKIFIYDFGVKSSILKILTHLGCEVTIIPNTISATEILTYSPDGIIISNGPGDPASIKNGVEEIRKIIFSGIPVLGICLGCQLIAIAAGGSTKKMKFGHHGANHPVYDIQKKKVYITSQNHNFVVDSTSLSPEFAVTHVSLFDGSLQGIKLKNYPVVGFQGHPEGSPGPHDIKGLFNEFLEVCSENAARSFH